jgi:FkbM family methyltransferase
VKILWHSVAPWAPTGYGQQTGQATPRIAAMGHDVALSIYYGHQGSEIRWRGLRCLPPYSSNYGIDMLMQHALHHFEAEDDPGLAEAGSRGLIVLLGDAWTFEVPMLSQMAAACWVPIDHLTLPDVTRRWFDVMGAVPIAMSRFGERCLVDAGFHPRYVPHGIETSIFKPGDQAEARELAGVPADAFAVGMVANNVGRDGSRKAFTEQIAAFAELRAKHSDAFFVLHTDVDQPIGVRLRAFLERTLPKGSYTFTDPYAYRKGLPPEGVARIYRTLDVLSNCSYGEGFGVPIIEAQACGVPVIVTDSTSMPELCGSGWRAGYERVWHDSQGGWTSVPRIGDIAEAMELAYDQARDPVRKLEAEVFAAQYDADAIAELHWRPVLADFAQALEDRRRDVEVRRSFARRVQVRERVVEADGYFWLDRGEGSDDWVTTADHENWLWPIWDRLLPDGGVLLDVGAHVGRWSIRLAPRADRVLAVEADPRTCRTLRRHLQMNDVANVEVHEVAAWDSRRTLDLEDPNGRIDGGGTRVTPASGNGHLAVMGQRLDRYQPILRSLKAARRLDVVKLDVEGADLHVLRGLRGILDLYRPAILLECHDLYGYYTRAELEAVLTDLGYRWSVAATVPSNWQPGVGIVSEVRDADYLECLPAEAGATVTTAQREGHHHGR